MKKFLLTGVETNNKGAELMLYAILQQIEEKFPNSDVYIGTFAIKQGFSYIKTPIHLKEMPYASFRKLLVKLKFDRILYHLNIPQTILLDPIIDDIDYLIDGSGLAFSDNMSKNPDNVRYWHKILTNYGKKRTKIIFLPQAFGPFETNNAQTKVKDLFKYADLIFARDPESYDYLKKLNLNLDKVHIYPDFTSLVNGIQNEKYKSLVNGVCIIPNMQMIDQGIFTLNEYIDFMVGIIEFIKKQGFLPYILNHQGCYDEKIGYLISQKTCNTKFITGINALEVKGIISTSRLCITSRFHGAASALNSCVPCLATSWSHKYKELFIDYNQHDCILEKDQNTNLKKIAYMLDDKNNKNIREALRKSVENIKEKTKEMWSLVWSF